MDSCMEGPISSILCLESSLSNQDALATLLLQIQIGLWEYAPKILSQTTLRVGQRNDHGLCDHRALVLKTIWKQNLYGYSREKTAKFLFVVMYMAVVGRWLGQRGMPEWDALQRNRADTLA